MIVGHCGGVERIWWLIDLDYFKRFNDTFGHEAGATVLREVAQFLQKFVRGLDISCRYGGEEFILILPNEGRDAIRTAS